MMKLLPGVILAAILLTGCGSTDAPKSEEPNPQSTEGFTMENGPLDPKTLKLEEFNVTASLAPCANEEFPVQSDVLAWDYDKDGAMDAVAVAKCPTGEERTTLIIGRATSRGWWNVLAVGGTEDNIELTGKCSEIEGSLVCPSKRFDIAEQKMIEGSLTVYLDEKNELMYGFKAS